MTRITKTGNIGHDVARMRAAKALIKKGYDIVAIRKKLLAHDTIRELIDKKAVQISAVIGMNVTVGCVNALYSDFVSVHYENGQTVAQVCNNIAWAIVKQYTESHKWGMMRWWKKYNKRHFRYSDRFIIGADILTSDWTADTYAEEFECKLSERAKVQKYGRHSRG